MEQRSPANAVGIGGAGRVARGPRSCVTRADLGLAEDLAHGASLDRTFESARTRLGLLGETCDVSHLLTELSALRDSIIAVWDGSASSGVDKTDLRAIHIAIDAVMAAAAERCDQASRSGFERVAEDRARRMQSILEHTPAAIWVKDHSGRIVLANHRLADALGHPYEQVIGRRSQDLLPAEVAAQHNAHDQIVVREHKAIATEEIVPAPDGVRTFLSIKFPLPGDPPMVGGIATDISERKQMEEELRVAVQSRERVLAAVSHDLRNPLSTIQFTSATLLSQLAGDQRWRRHLEIIHRSCLRMEHLITDLLDMASISVGRLSLQTQREPADAVLGEALDLHQPLAEEKKIALVLRAGSEGVFIECDRQRVMQVFGNLIGNALKFCRAGDTVTLASERSGSAVRFSVEDTGPGIAAELLAKLFDPYWSGPGSPSGVRLGLYIARGIVERHGGRIDVESTVGHGTRFSFSIPVAGSV